MVYQSNPYFGPDDQSIVLERKLYLDVIPILRDTFRQPVALKDTNSLI